MSLVSFETAPVEVFDSLDHVAGTPFTNLAIGNLPVLAVTRTTRREFLTLDPLQPTFDELGLELEVETKQSTRTMTASSLLRQFSPQDSHHNTQFPTDDVGLHTDGYYDPDDIDLSVHYTEQGIARALFFEFQPEVLALQGLPKNKALFRQATMDIRRGKVDDKIFIPVGHTAHTRPGTTLFFRRGGWSPLAHMFETTSIRRIFTVGWISSSIPTTLSVPAQIPVAAT